MTNLGAKKNYICSSQTSHPECFRHFFNDLRKNFDAFDSALNFHSKHSNFFCTRETYSIAYLQGLAICDEIWFETIDLSFSYSLMQCFLMKGWDWLGDGC